MCVCERGRERPVVFATATQPNCELTSAAIEFAAWSSSLSSSGNNVSAQNCFYICPARGSVGFVTHGRSCDHLKSGRANFSIFAQNETRERANPQRTGHNSSWTFSAMNWPPKKKKRKRQDNHATERERLSSFFLCLSSGCSFKFTNVSAAQICQSNCLRRKLQKLTTRIKSLGPLRGARSRQRPSRSDALSTSLCFAFETNVMCLFE